MPAITSRACRGSQLAGGEVVQEEQRLGALHHDVVDAHRHQVDADGVVDAGLDRDLQLGADAVGAGDQHRIDESRRLQVEQRAEAAEPAHHAGPVRRPRERLDRLDQRVGRRRYRRRPRGRSGRCRSFGSGS